MKIRYEERLKIKKMMDEGIKVSEIAQIIGVHRHSIYRELEYGKTSFNSYDPEYAQKRSDNERATIKRGTLLEKDLSLAPLISDMILKKRMYPEEISIILHKSNKKISTKSIYRYIENGLIPGVNKESLRKLQQHKVFSNGNICLPKWTLDLLGISDGDAFDLVVNEDDKSILLCFEKK